MAKPRQQIPPVLKLLLAQNSTPQYQKLVRLAFEHGMLHERGVQKRRTKEALELLNLIGGPEETFIG